MSTERHTLGCSYCKGGPEPGWIESDNNGPVYSCPICNPKGDADRKYSLAEAQRRLSRTPTST